MARRQRPVSVLAEATNAAEYLRRELADVDRDTVKAAVGWEHLLVRPDGHALRECDECGRDADHLVVLSMNRLALEESLDHVTDIADDAFSTIIADRFNNNPNDEGDEWTC